VCSIACRTKLIKEAGKKIAQCKKCNKNFTPTAKNKGTYSRYCSPKCYHDATSNRVARTCELCKREFNVIRFKAEKQGVRFCSRACWKRGRWAGETSIEKKVRVTLEELDIQYIAEYRVGRYQIDFYLPEYQIAVEADGAYWHRLKASHDARRDAVLLSRGITTIRLSEGDINHGVAMTILSQKLGITPKQCAEVHSQLPLFDLHTLSQGKPSDR
jgi:very-short-patch-repair endonuclease